jgi:hypothetical protein
MWKIFKIFKKKKVLSMKEYDELVDKKANDIRAFILSNLTIRDDDNPEKLGNFMKEFDKAFTKYQAHILIKLLRESERKGKQNVKSPYFKFEEFYKKYGKKRKSKWSFLLNFIYKAKVRVRLFFYQVWMYFQIRKIKKLFPDMKISSKTALNLINSAKINKRLMAVK